ncbi:MAG: hypothetical protein OJJ21_16750 [Ferrovibrio sp.]|uniref:hypothetical protein n=1 Tax=Ferrovibrio sp. TaxID=1917215 RepID=UPI002620CDBE|nr:hypothetical protein [Ferrovibrio sp.]MCW0235252.1 hypothetical protein [Ferrovibrio sp.]
MRDLAEKIVNESYDGTGYELDHYTLIDKIAAALEDSKELGRHEVLSAITFVGPDGGVYNAKLDFVDLREFLS